MISFPAPGSEVEKLFHAVSGPTSVCSVICSFAHKCSWYLSLVSNVFGEEQFSFLVWAVLLIGGLIEKLKTDRIRLWSVHESVHE